MDFLDEWRILLAAQDGVVTRRQLLARGFTDEGIEAQLAARRWRRLHDGVYLTHAGPATSAQRRRAAILACRGTAALSHETAGELWGLSPPSAEDAPIHVTVPYGTSTSRDDGLVVHRSRAFVHITVAELDPPRVSRVHTVVDLAVAAPDAPSAMRLVHRLAFEGRVRPPELERALELRRPPRYANALRDAIDLLQEDLSSELERRYALDVERAHRLPTGTRQAPVVVDGQRLHEDVLYRMPRGRFVVRLDGHRYHLDRATTLRDRRRAVATTVQCVPSAPYGWDEVDGHPCRTAREVATVLRQLGWTEDAHPCTRCT